MAPEQDEAVTAGRLPLHFTAGDLANTLTEANRAMGDEGGNDDARIVRWQEDEETSSWNMHSITIQSPYIRQVLHKVFEDYAGVSTELKDLTFRAPFHEFFFRWQKFQNLLREEQDEKVKEHCEVLVEALKDQLKPHLDRTADLRKHGLVSFDYLWALYEPGCEVYAKTDEGERLYIVNDSYVTKQNNAEVHIVLCRFIEFDGDKLGFDTARRKISPFKGVKAVTDLPLYPSKAHPDLDGVRERLERRGRKFLEHCGVRYKQYSGFFLTYDGSIFGPKKQHIGTGRIVIDVQSFAQENYSDSPTDLDPLSNALLVYCSPMVRGFNLSNKKWAGFFVDSIHEIEWSVHAFDKLLLRQQYKKMILAFVKSHLSSVDDFDDVIKGKGQGFIMLLCGDPGVGKTLTAESVAEEMKQPLYAMTAGELGSTTDDVETSLQRVLNLCAKWHAVLLMDECDVFLEQRSATDLERNKLVSVFLRLLEYYKGVMLLTTNRASAVDPAFLSRIHLSINYPNLDGKARKQIWQTFVQQQANDQVNAQPITDSQLDTLAELNFNGREIKNIARSARLLAAQDNVPLGYEHLQTVLDVKTDADAARIA
ncbi:hypothetical protein M409DRAFT_63881 [Zasmidium cellare ATCC 36951]|uniref:AAA+ ATPase domain-containing protein n=1 Tax=Zasmidium cellare ATCC 36951 TaxID=1080233 RepID=A0A6A6CUQ1_ZASCE|nr:uncharacterized protein M409DRAFT_63881 [Zasmidium cellare ATCC 36951]KAF2170831.1 hypothetical protein M409DRAFT_63881 [Zasmidium cellare ATCC 36951]